MKLKTITLAISLGLITACASTPETHTGGQGGAQQASDPIFVRPAPVSPVTGDNLGSAVTPPDPGTVQDFIYAAGEDRVFFDYDQYDLTLQARSVLRRQAEWLNRYQSVTVVVAGNADERGTREYNLALGARRADSVKAYLVSQGVSPNRMTTVSFGKERPIDNRSNEAGWARNRNGHTRIVSGAIG